MFKRVRQLRISLAAKCQILFGAAVVLIIAAALIVAGQRVEQLTDQLNERSARTLAGYAVAGHIERHTDVAPPTTAPVAIAPQVAAVPTTAPAAPEGTGYAQPRLLLIQGEIPDDAALTPFERWAARRLARHPEQVFTGDVYDRADGVEGYRLAQIGTACTPCHTAAEPALTLAAAATQQTAPGTDTDEPTGDETLPPAPPTPLVGVVVVDIPSQIETNQLLLNRVVLLTAGLLAGSVALVVFYLIITRLILHPVRVLQETAEKVSEGDLNIRSDINSGDEFQQLSETLNTMLTNLKNSNDQLKAVNKSLDLRLGQLAETNVALYESNRLKTEFLANVSHELRTPLNSILGFAELLRDTSGDAKAVRYVQNILNSGRNLLELINDLLDLAKIEAGRMDVRSEPLSLGDLFEGLISLLKPLSEARKVAIAPDVAADVPIIRTDPPKLQQVLYNLLSNAIKFSPVGGQIELSARRVGDRIRIAVTDHGPGIAPDKQEVIFEKFRQLDASVTRQHGGTGLGLAISRELVTLLAGTIGIDSTPGQGATFWLLLPVSITAAQHDVRQAMAMT